MESDFSPSQVNVADEVALFLKLKKVPSVYELSGGMIVFLTDAIFKLGATQVINMRHEQAAGFAAEGAARVLNQPTVALATSGPGATNLITAIGSAYFDSTPIVFITGQVNQNELKVSEDQRQNGFQELNIVKIVSSITKFAYQVTNEDHIKNILDLAWNEAITGRPGPVLVDIPIDIQQQAVKLSPKNSVIINRHENSGELNLDRVILALANATSPLVIAGGGIRSAGAVDEFRSFIENVKIPVVHSLMGSDALPSNSMFRVGMLGSYGNRWANKAVADADLLLVLGSRLDVRQTGNDLLSFTKDKYLIRVDIDETEIMGRVRANIEIRSDLKKFLAHKSLNKCSFNNQAFISKIQKWKEIYPIEAEQSEQLELNPNNVMEWISKVFEDSNGYIVDVGQHQMWAAQSLEIGCNQRFITSGGMGAMGFSIPAAIGSAISKTGKWIAIVGDGCAQLSLPELQTLVHYDLPIAVCVINNEQHGMVAQFQEENTPSRYISTREGYSAPSFSLLAKAFGIPTTTMKNGDDLAKVEKFVKSWEKGPILIEIFISQKAKALPKLGRKGIANDI